MQFIWSCHASFVPKNLVLIKLWERRLIFATHEGATGEKENGASVGHLLANVDVATNSEALLHLLVHGVVLQLDPGKW